MNRFWAIFQLDELKGHIDDVISEINEGDYDEDGELSYEVAIGHLLDHLNLAWHYARMSEDQIESKSQEQFERLIKSVPNLMGYRRLVNPYKDALGTESTADG